MAEVSRGLGEAMPGLESRDARGGAGLVIGPWWARSARSLYRATSRLTSRLPLTSGSRLARCAASPLLRPRGPLSRRREHDAPQPDVRHEPWFEAVRAVLLAGTCAGAYRSSREVRPRQPSLGLLDAVIERNAWADRSTRSRRACTLRRSAGRSSRLHSRPALPRAGRHAGEPVLVRQDGWSPRPSTPESRPRARCTATSPHLRTRASAPPRAGRPRSAARSAGRSRSRAGGLRASSRTSRGSARSRRRAARSCRTAPSRPSSAPTSATPVTNSARA